MDNNVAFPMRSRPIPSKLTKQVENIHHLLRDDAQYRRCLEAVYDSQAVEGALELDDLMAARMLRQKALLVGNPIGGEKLEAIVEALNTMLYLDGESRWQRRNMLREEIVPGGDVDADNLDWDKVYAAIAAKARVSVERAMDTVEDCAAMADITSKQAAICLYGWQQMRSSK